jgi:GNAT superfamily N-acetyltransferase
VIRIRLMTASDVAAGMRLKSQAGWNQVEADWRRFLAMQPDGCFVAECAGAAVGTTVACIFDDVAWLAMVLVDAAHRGQGIGTTLVRHALAFLDAMGVRRVRLDATPQGQPLYETLGFVAEYELARYDGVLSAVDEISELVRVARPDDYDQICTMDRAVVGADRRKFLFRLYDEAPQAVRIVERAGEVAGYLTVRRGSEAVQIGPCAATADAGAALLADAARRHVGKRAIIDAPLVNTAAVRCVESLGLAVRRTFLRMYRGEAQRDDVCRLWASSGPELG